MSWGFPGGEGGGSGTGDMSKAVYDPTVVAGDAFSRSNHTGTQLSSTISDFVSAAIAAVTVPISSIFGRTGAIVAVLGDYAASLISNDSAVSGATVKDALEVHESAIAINTAKVGNIEYSTLLFGAKFDSAGRYAQANARASDADETSKPKTRQPCVAAGTITRVAWFSQFGDATVLMNIRVDGVVLDSFNLTGSSGHASVSAAVSAGSYVELQYDSGTQPKESTWNLTLELS